MKDKNSHINFFDPIVIMLIIMAFVSDVLIIIFILHYIVSLIILLLLFRKFKGFLAKTLFILIALFPLPFLSIGVILCILLSNSKLLRFIANQVAIQIIAVATGGAGEALEGAEIGGEVALEGAETVGVASEGAGVASEISTRGTEIYSKGLKVSKKVSKKEEKLSEHKTKIKSKGAENINKITNKEYEPIESEKILNGTFSNNFKNKIKDKAVDFIKHKLESENEEYEDNELNNMSDEELRDLVENYIDSINY